MKNSNQQTPKNFVHQIQRRKKRTMMAGDDKRNVQGDSLYVQGIR